jgi:hypothetical protein
VSSGPLFVSGEKRGRISGRQAINKEITWCNERALEWPPPVGVRGVVLFLFTVLKNRLALMRHTFACWDMQIDFPVPQSCHRIVGL